MAFLRYTLLFLALCTCLATAQERIDGVFAFSTDPAKRYSLYIPTTYNPDTPNPVMVAMHAFNTARWNSVSWRDTLTAFAEQNGLILVAPDGGTDGQVTDQIDTAFTTALLDSVARWYTLDPARTFIMGFSVGGYATYAYGLANAWRFCGFMPIGAAVNGTVGISTVLPNANGKPFYLITGGDDFPNVRHYPMVDNLLAENGIVEGVILPGVQHTMDFANRDKILTEAYVWLDSVCAANSTSSVGQVGNNDSDSPLLRVYPNPIRRGSVATMEYTGKAGENIVVQAIASDGLIALTQRYTFSGNGSAVSLDSSQLPVGSYVISIAGQHISASAKIVVE